MKKSELTKQRILQAAILLFSQNGYGNTSTKDIATLAKVSEATLFKHFKTKDGLFKAILFSLVKELNKISITNISLIILAKHKNKQLYHTLSAIIDNRIQFLNSHDSTIKAIIQEALTNQELKAQIQQSVWPEVSLTLSNLFDKAIASNEIQARETKYLTSSFFSAITGPIIASYLVPSYDNSTRALYIKNNFENFYASLLVPIKEESHE